MRQGPSRAAHEDGKTIMLLQYAGMHLSRQGDRMLSARMILIAGPYGQALAD